MSLNTHPDLLNGGLNAPITHVPSKGFRPDPARQIARYRHTIRDDVHMDALIVNNGVGPLVVNFHGALDRKKNTLPRFERLRSMLDYDVPSMFVADPALWLADKEWFQLAWYTGWEGFDAHRLIADWATSTALAIGADRIIFTGSSGGGFAALQTSALVPNSLCLAFNPQTSIHGYLANGDHWGAQRNYRRVVWPDIDAVDVGPDGDWTADLDDRVSALRRYGRSVDNYVLYADNPNDFHHEQHYVPFMKAARANGNADRVQTYTYEGPNSHTPPTPDQFRSALDAALVLAQGLPPVLPTPLKY